MRGIHWWPVNSPHKGPVTRKTFPFDYVIMLSKIPCKARVNEAYCTVPNASVMVWLIAPPALTTAGWATFRKCCYDVDLHGATVMSSSATATSTIICLQDRQTSIRRTYGQSIGFDGCPRSVEQHGTYHWQNKLLACKALYAILTTFRWCSVWWDGSIRKTRLRKCNVCEHGPYFVNMGLTDSG